jgi:aquaporin Z
MPRPASFQVVREHWPEYLMEAAGLGLFMVSAAVVTTLLEYPHSPLHDLFTDRTTRRLLIGLAMGLTAIGLIYSPWGKRSGAHFNPAVTMTFFRLGKVAGVDAACYLMAQFIGGLMDSWRRQARSVWPSNIRPSIMSPQCRGPADRRWHSSRNC